MKKLMLCLIPLTLLVGCGNGKLEPADVQSVGVGNVQLQENPYGGYSANLDSQIGDVEINAFEPLTLENLSISKENDIEIGTLKISNEIISSIENKIIDKYELRGNNLSNSMSVRIELKEAPEYGNFDSAYVYQVTDDIAQEANETELDLITTGFLSSESNRQSLKFIVVKFNRDDFKKACQNAGLHFTGVSCIENIGNKYTEGGLSSQGISDNKLTVLSINVGNANPDCLGVPYNVKLCQVSDEDKAMNTISQLYPDLILLQEVFNNDCKTPPSGVALQSLSSGLESQFLRWPRPSCFANGERKQISRILPKDSSGNHLYDFRCSRPKAREYTFYTTRPPRKEVKMNLYHSGYECIALKKGFLEFEDNSSFLGEISPNCDDGRLNPMAVGGPFDGSDTGSYYAKIRARGYNQTFYAVTAHLISPPQIDCRLEQINAFARWQDRMDIKYIYGGDFNTDPHVNLPLTTYNDRARSELNRWFYTSYRSENANYDRNFLAGSGKIGYRVSKDTIATANVGPIKASLDHIHSNFAFPYYTKKSSDCQTGNAGTKLDFDHDYVLCPVNISSLKN